jgi:magnesium transporter
MARFIKNQKALQGKSPSDLLFIGKKKTDEVVLREICYAPKHIFERKLSDISEAFSDKDEDSITWLDVTGLHDTRIIGCIGERFGIHPLILEDILNTGQRPKIEEFDTYICIILKMMRFDDTDKKIHAEQLSLVFGKNYLITFQERPGDVFDPVRVRLRNQNGRIRRSGADYLAYALIDTIVDNYLILIERLGEQIEDVELRVLENPGKEVLVQLNNHNRELNYLRKSIRPAKDVISQFGRLDSELLHDNTFPFLRDLHDLIIQTVEGMDTYGEMLHDHLDIHATNVGNRLNEIIKFLTIFSAIFIPLTFLAGIYGTNFHYLPELSYRYSYFIFLAALVVIAVGMIFIFKRKKWL